MHQHGGYSFTFRVGLGLIANKSIDFMHLTLFFVPFIKKKIKSVKLPFKIK